MVNATAIETLPSQPRRYCQHITGMWACNKHAVYEFTATEDQHKAVYCEEHAPGELIGRLKNDIRRARGEPSLEEIYWANVAKHYPPRPAPPPPATGMPGQGALPLP